MRSPGREFVFDFDGSAMVLRFDKTSVACHRAERQVGEQEKRGAHRIRTLPHRWGGGRWPICLGSLDQARRRRSIALTEVGGSQVQAHRSTLALDMQGFLLVNTRDNQGGTMKVTVIGAAGSVGAPAAFYIAASGLADEMVLIDMRQNVVEHHAMDLSTAVSALDVKVKAGGYEDLAARTWSSTPRGCRRASSPTAWRCSPRTSPWCATSRCSSSATARRRSSSRPPIRSTRSTTPSGSPAGSTAVSSIGYSLNDSIPFPRDGRAGAKGSRSSRVEASVIGEHGSTQVPLFSSVRIDGEPGLVQRGGEAGHTRRRSPPSSSAGGAEGRAGRPAGRAPSDWRRSRGPSSTTPARSSRLGGLEGEYGRQGISMSVPIRLGKTGIQEILEWELAPDERAAFERSAEQLMAAAPDRGRSLTLVRETSRMTQRFEKLLEPGMIGPVKTRNRMIKTANGTSFMEADQTVGPRMIA